MNEVMKIEMRNELLILCGDMNKHLGDEIVPGKTKKTHGGKLLLEFLSNKEYILLNATDKMVNGPYTRYDPSDPDNEDKQDQRSTAPPCFPIYHSVNHYHRNGQNMSLLWSKHGPHLVLQIGSS